MALLFIYICTDSTTARNTYLQKLWLLHGITLAYGEHRLKMTRSAIMVEAYNQLHLDHITFEFVRSQDVSIA